MSEDQIAHDLLADIYRTAKVVRNGEFWTTVNRFTDQTEPLPPRILIEVAWAMVRRIPPDTSIILGEEEKGASIATTVSIFTGIPLVLARYYTYPVEQVHPAAVSADIQHEYYSGKLIVNGLRKGQIATIIEDTVSTGGTISGLAEVCRQADVHVVSVISAVEKINYGGRSVVNQCFGLDPDSILRIKVSEHGVEIVSTRAWEASGQV